MPTFHLAAIASHWYVGNSLRGDGLYLCISMIIYANLVSHVVEGSCHAQICSCFKCVQLLQDVTSCSTVFCSLGSRGIQPLPLFHPFSHPANGNGQRQVLQCLYLESIEIWNATWTFGSHGPANWDFLQKAHFQNPARAARVWDWQGNVPSDPSPGENTIMRIMLSL